jgi:hypothetical protein
MSYFDFRLNLSATIQLCRIFYHARLINFQNIGSGLPAAGLVAMILYSLASSSAMDA